MHTNGQAPEDRRPASWLALGLSLFAVGVWLMPEVADVLQYDRAALAGGELWRAVAGHWAHWSADHLVWDLAMFAVFGALLERRSRARFVAVVVLSAVAIPAALWFAAPEFEYYRGLSGIDSALFAAFFAQLLADAWRSRSCLGGAVPVVALLGFGGKSTFELLTGSTVFVADGVFTAVPLAHLVGAAVGVAAGVARCARVSVPTIECSLNC